MLKKSITYTDFNDKERTEDFYFNLTKAEILEMDLDSEGGLANRIQKITEEQDSKKVFVIFKDIILKAYGEKTPDGKRFIKSAELSSNFASSEAYSELFMEFLKEDGAANFINGIIPKQEKSMNSI